MIDRGNGTRGTWLAAAGGRVGDAVAPVVAVIALFAAADRADAHGHGGHGHGGGRNAQAIKDANSWRDGFRGPHDFGGGVRIPQDAGVQLGLGGGLDGRGFGAAASPLDGGGRLDGSDWALDGGATAGYRGGAFAGSADHARPKPKAPAGPTK